MFMPKKLPFLMCLFAYLMWITTPAVHQANAQEVDPTPTPIVDVTEIVVDDPSGVEAVPTESVDTVSEELAQVMNNTLRDTVLAVLVVAGTIFGLLSGALATIVYIALKFTHKSVTPEAVKDIFLLGVQKGTEGLVDVATRIPMPYEIDDKLAGAIASGVGRYFKEIGFNPNHNQNPPVPPSPEAIPRG